MLQIECNSRQSKCRRNNRARCKHAIDISASLDHLSSNGSLSHPRFCADYRFYVMLCKTKFLRQDELPCLTEEGRIILETRTTVARAPNGNGGLFAALIKQAPQTPN